MSFVNKSHIVFLSIGSNLGDRNQNIQVCLDNIKRIGKIIKMSSIIETKPYEVIIQQNDFYNLVIKLAYQDSPQKLLLELNEIEEKMGRVRRGIKNEPRIIDIDIIFFDKKIVNEDNLEIPHPRYSERFFVLIPMNEIASNFKDPRTKKRISEILKNTQNRSNKIN